MTSSSANVKFKLKKIWFFDPWVTRSIKIQKPTGKADLLAGQRSCHGCPDGKHYEKLQHQKSPPVRIANLREQAHDGDVFKAFVNPSPKFSKFGYFLSKEDKGSAWLQMAEPVRTVR